MGLYSREDYTRYEQVLQFYSTLKLYAMLGRMDRKEEEYWAWYQVEHHNAKLLKTRNRDIVDVKRRAYSRSAGADQEAN